MAAVYNLQTDEINGGSGRREVQMQVVYTAEPYSAGLPVVKEKMGLPTVMESLEIIAGEPANANLYKYDPSTQKIRIYTAATGVEVSGNQSVTVVLKAQGW